MGEIEEHVTVFTDTSILCSYSLTILTTLLEEKDLVIADLRKESNTQWDFLLFLAYCVHNKFLSEGDYLILDNAAVHVGDESFQIINLLLKAAGVNLVFLPTYSPELNAAEYVFQVVKSYIQINQTSGNNLWWNIACGIASINRSIMIKFYLKLLLGWMKPFLMDG